MLCLTPLSYSTVRMTTGVGEITAHDSVIVNKFLVEHSHACFFNVFLVFALVLQRQN